MPIPSQGPGGDEPRLLYGSHPLPAEWMIHRPLPQQGDVSLLHCTLLTHLSVTSKPLGPHDLSMNKGRLSLPGHSSHPHTPNTYQLAPSAHSQTHRILELERISEAILVKAGHVWTRARQDLPQVIQQNRIQPQGSSHNPTPRAVLPE